MENPTPAKKSKQPVKNNPSSPSTIVEPAKTANSAPIVHNNTNRDAATIPEVVYSNEQIIVKIKAAPSPKETIKPESKRGRKSFKEINATVDLIDVPDDETLQKKLYYSISEVASWFKVNTSLLRYWENEFDILQPRKTRKGDRLFRAEDIKNLELIYFLLRQRKFSIEGAKSYLKNNKGKIDTETQLVQVLTSFKGFLLELKSSLDNKN
ncbi:MAG: MerR family transcriptional regulator [Sphingobacteriia bacterium]|nr:MAG: MerR family transcriptional regulator [Sphingobacteriia bacterium]